MIPARPAPISRWTTRHRRCRRRSLADVELRGAYLLEGEPVEFAAHTDRIAAGLPDREVIDRDGAIDLVRVAARVTDQHGARRYAAVFLDVHIHTDALHRCATARQPANHDRADRCAGLHDFRGPAHHLDTPTDVRRDRREAPE